MSAVTLPVLVPLHLFHTISCRPQQACVWHTFPPASPLLQFLMFFIHIISCPQHVCVWHTRVRMAHTCAYGTHVCVWHTLYPYHFMPTTRVRMAHTCAYGTHFIHINHAHNASAYGTHVCVWHTLYPYHFMPTTCVRMAHTCAYGTHFIHIISCPQHVFRVGQNCIYTPYMTVYLVISLPKLPYIHRIYMVLANPTRVRMAHAAAHIPSSLQALYTSQ